MPTVSLYGYQKVDPTPLPGVRKTAAETPESEGYGLFQAQARGDETKAAVFGQAGQIAANVVGDLQQKAKQQANLAVDLQQTSDLSQLQTKLTIAGQNVKGKDAIGMPDKVLADFDTAADDISQSADTDEQRTTFEKRRAAARINLRGALERHANEQFQQYTAQASDALVENKGNEAVLNVQEPRVAIAAVADQVTAIKASGKALGQSPDVIQARIAATTTATARGLIFRALDDGNVDAAAAYYHLLGPGTSADPGQNLINGEKLGDIEKALAFGQAKNDGIHQADAIIASGGTLAEQLDKAKALPDAVRVVAEQRIEHANSLKQAQERQSAETVLKGAYDLLDQTRGDYAQIPTSIIATLPGSERSALQSYGARLAAGEKTETDWPTYYARMTQASSDPDAFTKVNLLSDRAKLGDVEFKQLTELQSSIRKGDRAAADKTLAPFTVSTQMVNDALTRYGIDPASKDATVKKSIATLRTMLRQNVTDLETLTGKKASDVDIQSQLDKILSTSEKVPGSWWGLVPFTATHLRDTTKSVVTLTLADVPTADRAQIESALRRSGRPVSDATIVDAYQQMQLRKPK